MAKEISYIDYIGKIEFPLFTSFEGEKFKIHTLDLRDCPVSLNYNAFAGQKASTGRHEWRPMKSQVRTTNLAKDIEHQCCLCGILYKDMLTYNEKVNELGNELGNEIIKA